MKAQNKPFKSERRFSIEGEPVNILEKLRYKVRKSKCDYVTNGMIHAYKQLDKPYPKIGFVELLAAGFMDLLIQYAYPQIRGFARFTPIVGLAEGEEDRVLVGICPAITLTHGKDNKHLSKVLIYNQIYDALINKSEYYKSQEICSIHINVYSESHVEVDDETTPREELDRILQSVMVRSEHLEDVYPKIATRENKEARYPDYLTSLPNRYKKKMEAYKQKVKANKDYKGKPPSPASFIVADIETLLIDDIQYPYAAGFMMVRPGQPVDRTKINVFYSDDYKIILSEFTDRSTKILTDMIESIKITAKKERRCVTVYFHNLARFDGIFLLRHLTLYHKDLKLKTLMRNTVIYEIKVYSEDNNRLIFQLRCSLQLLPRSLHKLGQRGNFGRGSVSKEY